MNRCLLALLTAINPGASGKRASGRRYRRQYVALRAFADYHGRRFGAGDILTFLKQDFARYEGYYVLTFREAVMTAAEEGEVMNNFDTYLAESA